MALITGPFGRSTSYTTNRPVGRSSIRQAMVRGNPDSHNQVRRTTSYTTNRPSPRIGSEPLLVPLTGVIKFTAGTSIAGSGGGGDSGPTQSWASSF